MSTRSNIIAKTKEGYKVIYCHSDGYPEWVGATLKKHYTKPEPQTAFSLLANSGKI